jgi:desulfoferrodoxin (superoxide reductase-like protein)
LLDVELNCIELQKIFMR